MSIEFRHGKPTSANGIVEVFKQRPHALPAAVTSAQAFCTRDAPGMRPPRVWDAALQTGFAAQITKQNTNRDSRSALRVLPLVFQHTLAFHQNIHFHKANVAEKQ